MNGDPALVFALTLKRWFAANDFPQLITDSWAKDEGIKYPHGPWASQMCAAMKGAGYSPKAEFFLALAEFNRFIAEQDLTRIKGSKLRDRLKDAKPLCTDDGTPYGGAEFWSLFAGLLQPPAEYAKAPEQLTEEDVQEWARQVREGFRRISLKHMVDRGEAWAMLKGRMLEIAEADGGDPIQDHDCLDWTQEVLAGLREPTVAEAIRMAKRWTTTHPLQRAMEDLLGTKNAEVDRIRKKAADSKPEPLPFGIGSSDLQALGSQPSHSRM